MSPDPVKLVRELFDLQSAGRFDELAARYRDDAVIRPASDSGTELHGGQSCPVPRGRPRPGAEINPNLLTYARVGDAVLVTGRMVIRQGDAQGISDSPVTWRFELDSEGLIARAEGIRGARPPE